MKFNRTPRE